MRSRSRRSGQNADVWPGFVDALASVLLVFVFLLLIFVLGQFYLTDMLQGRNETLNKKQTEINALVGHLKVEQDKSSKQTTELLSLNKILEKKKVDLIALTQSLEELTKNKNELETKVARLAVTLEHQEQLIDDAQIKKISDEALILQLTQEANQLNDNLKKNQQHLQQTTELSDTQKADILNLLATRQLLEADVAKLAARLDQQKEALALANTLSETLEEQLKNTQLLSEKKIAELSERDLRLRSMVDRIAQIEQLLKNEQQVNLATSTDHTALALKLKETEKRNLALSSELALSQDEVEKLGQRLNVQLAKKVQELNRYRSEFFGQLREVLGDRDDITIVGDRFLFQSEVLFASGSDVLGAEGLTQLTQLAKTLLDVSKKIPADLEWIVRVDGHTDSRPIHNEIFDSNWELSTARALSIVKFLITQQIAPEHLAATGFGEFHPLDLSDTPAAFNKNRRIEIKLTNR